MILPSSFWCVTSSPPLMLLLTVNSLSVGILLTQNSQIISPSILSSYRSGTLAECLSTLPCLHFLSIILSPCYSQSLLGIITGYHLFCLLISVGYYCQEYSFPFSIVAWDWNVTIKCFPIWFNLNFHLTFWYKMPSQRLRRSISLPLLQIKRLRRHLSFTHLAPIPEVPLRMPSHPDPEVIDQLLESIDFYIEDSRIKTSRSTWTRVGFFSWEFSWSKGYKLYVLSPRWALDFFWWSFISSYSQY
jgi:hypothetical protein